ncbi:MAG: hypothetical protein NC820_07050 [Candidatus Omnitrophica bacterium]|nr:hypothetical protein [Candidatus Omnitrophota bacterium]
MIRKAFVEYLKDNVPELKSVKVSSPDLVLSKEEKPFITVSFLSDRQTLWEISDTKRQQNLYLQINLFTKSFDEQMILKNKVLRVLENAETNGETGIPLMGYFDKLETIDYIVYTSFQDGWSYDFIPKVYRNGVLVNETEYTVNYDEGYIRFNEIQGPTADIRADYKVGVVDFNISSINDVPITDVDNITHKFSTFFTIEMFLYIKRKGRKFQ